MILNFQDQTYNNWQHEFERLENDFDSFRNYFSQNKKCSCNIDECKHFDKALVSVLGERTNNICKSRLNIGFRTYFEIIKNN